MWPQKNILPFLWVLRHTQQPFSIFSLFTLFVTPAFLILFQHLDNNHGRVDVDDVLC